MAPHLIIPADPRSAQDFPVRYRGPAAEFLVLWFVLQAYSGFGLLLAGTHAAGGVAWWAHSGGFAAGAGLTLRARRSARALRRRA